MSPIRFLSLCLLLALSGQLTAQCFVTAGNGGFIYDETGTDSVGYMTSVSSTALMVNLGNFNGVCGLTFPAVLAPWSGNSDGVLSTVTYNFSSPVKGLDMMLGFVGLNGVTARESFVIQTDGEAPLLTVDAGSCSGWIVTEDTITSPDIPNALNAIVEIDAVTPFTTLTISTYSTSIGIEANGGSSYAFCRESLVKCEAVYDTMSVQSCGAYSSPGGKTYTSSGTYTDTLLAVNGCDSVLIIELDLTEPVEVAVDLDLGTVLTADLAGLSYQWGSCDSDFVAISGATDQSFEVTASGNYAVIVESGSCRDTSACMPVEIIGPSGFSTVQTETIQLYPNPVKDHFYINGIQSESAFQIFSTAGKLVQEGVASATNKISIALEPGLYHINIITSGGIRSKQFLVID